ncbi:hypothetical protein CAPTEDRAFT_172561 [Capitella teleta]|uniref:Lysosomal enzyme trafficking factor n=1 Tax=Capitella teleta TaxID=283909 RepID=R7TZY4_CAPTE|nr:hypothetical protein CAPTEDRAFT_172561 [Capitella teleta]|eukprot:ELT99513.1 hypothetical protein CAPTEDRAFT_172561 [Capitella teleta]
MRRMNFRQRLSWLLAAVFLAVSCALVYYIFELSDSFNTLALDHIQRYHTDTQSSSSSSLLSHISDIPFHLLVVIIVLPYLQVFCMIIACTKPEPRLSLAFIWPVFVASCFRQIFCRKPTKTSRGVECAVNSPIANGRPLLIT